MIRLYSISLGCPKNRVDTERALGPLASFTSLVPVDAPEKADLVFINTCGFIAPAIEESVGTIVQAIESISELPENKRPLLVLAGCLVGRYGENVLAPDLPEVDLFLDTRPDRSVQQGSRNDGPAFPDSADCQNPTTGVSDVSATAHACDAWAGKLLAALSARGLLETTEQPGPRAVAGAGTQPDQSTPKKRVQGMRPRVMAQKARAVHPSAAPSLQDSSPLQRVPSGVRLLSTGPSYAWLKISDGCRHACSFCTIPSIRGPLRSTTAEELVREASLLLDQGVKELVLVAQDLTAWGADLAPGQDLRHLLEKLLPLGGLERLRLMYLYPAGLTKELLSFLHAAGKPFVPYFDVPLQHAAQGVLSRMGRPFAGRPREAVSRIRQVFPDAALRTSLIVGFPGETTGDFEELVRFVQDTRFHHLGVFSYQAEDGTPAAAMPDQIPEEEKERRRALLMALQAEISEELLEANLGTTEDVLVDSVHPEWPGLHVGRTWFQAPESDGITYVSGRGVVPGAMVKADIVETKEYDLVALAEDAANR